MLSMHKETFQGHNEIPVNEENKVLFKDNEGFIWYAVPSKKLRFLCTLFHRYDKVVNYAWKLCFTHQKVQCQSTQ